MRTRRRTSSEPYRADVMRQTLSPLLCPAAYLDALDAEALVRRVMRTALHAPAAWPILREAMAYRCDPVSGVAAAESLADAVVLWRRSGRRPPRLHAPSDPNPAPDEDAAIGALAAIQACRASLAMARLEWLFPRGATATALAVWAAAAGNLDAAGLRLERSAHAAPPPPALVAPPRLAARA